MNLFIVGNGFDIGHGLPTSYWDFRTYLDSRYPEFLSSFEQHYYIYSGMVDEAKKRLLWNQLESNLANIDEDIIIEDALGIELSLDSGDVGIEDTLYYYFKDNYKYIELLAKYLKQWVRTIKFRDIQPKTNLIDGTSDSLFITFNYTSVLEIVYGISEKQIVHIHGSLRQRDGEPILGHGNKDRINRIQEKRQAAEREFDEKEISICRVIKEYYEHTIKDIDKYTFKLLYLKDKNIDEIIVIGHSVAGIDIPYFQYIDMFTKQMARWKVYYYCIDEKERIFQSLMSCGIDKSRLNMISAVDFYNL